MTIIIFIYSYYFTRNLLHDNQQTLHTKKEKIRTYKICIRIKLSTCPPLIVQNLQFTYQYEYYASFTKYGSIVQLTIIKKTVQLMCKAVHDECNRFMMFNFV